MAACEHCQLSCQYQVQVNPTRSQVLYSGILPEIPGELLVKMFIHKKEEQALGIGEEYTHGWRRENLIPDSDGLMAMMEDQQKRERSDTVSTTLSDKPASKRPRYKGIPEPVPE
jgi:hypothetical protein